MDQEIKKTYKYYLRISNKSPKNPIDYEDEQHAFHKVRHHLEKNPCDEIKFIRMKHKFNQRMRERSFLGIFDRLTFNYFNPWSKNPSWI